MKNCPRCGSTVSENGLFCLNCGYKYSDDPQIPDEDEQNDETDLSFTFSILAIVFSSVSTFVVIIGGLSTGFSGAALGIVVCIISLILAINAYHAEKSETMAKLGIWLSFVLLLFNLVFGFACNTLIIGKSNSISGSCGYSFGCSNEPFYCDGAQFNPFYKK